MKKNKFVIYIVMFFAFFLIGNIKVKAADYIGCEYTIPENKLKDDYGLKHVNADYKMFIAFRDTKPYFLYTTDNAYSSGKYSDNDAAVVSTENLEIGNTDSGKCPNVKFKKRFRLGVWTNIDGGDFVETSPSLLFKISLVSADCSYVEKDTNEELKINLDYSKGNMGFIFGEPKGVNVLLRDNANDKVQDITSFYSNMYNGCPMSIFKDNGGLFYASDGKRKLSGAKNTYSVVKSDTCPLLNDLDYKLSKEYVDSIQVDQINETTKADFARNYKIRFTAWQNLINKNNGLSLENCDEKDAIQQKFDAIGTKLNEYGLLSDEELSEVKTTTKDLSSKDITWQVEYGQNDDDMACEEIFDDEVMDFIRSVFTWVRIGVPILLIVLGAIDFSQVVISQDPDAMKKCTSKFVKRCIVAVIIFFLPTLILLILQWINDYVMSTNPDCVISNLSIIMKSIWK